MRERQAVTVEDRELGFSAYLVIEPSPRELSFGGVRIDPSVTSGMVGELAENMSLKLAAHGSPVGGAKAGLCASPDDPRLPDMLRRFAVQCRDALTSTTILGKDMGAKQWMLDEIYASLGTAQLALAQRRMSGAHRPERPFELAGYVQNMTGRGVFWSIDQALAGRLRGSRVLIQGFGVVGSGLALHLDRAGALVVGVSDRDKAIVDDAGIDVDAVIAAKDDNGLVAVDRLPAAHAVCERDELLTQAADVLVLAAGSYVVDRDCALRVRAPLVVEGANLALLPEARSWLHDSAVRVVPDVVANSASAALVGCQIAAGNALSPAALWAEIEGSIRRYTDEVDRLSKAYSLEPKSAFRRLFEVEARRGPERAAGNQELPVA